jgi:hypothetical protein
MSIAKNSFALVCFFLLPSLFFHADVHARGIRTRIGSLKEHHTRVGAAKIRYVTIKNFQNNDFKTMGEYFGDHREHQYFRCIGRDDPGKRPGLYFIVGLGRSVTSLPKDLFAKIYIATDLKEKTREFRIKIPEERSSIPSEIYCGITSLPLDPSKINAWRIEFVDGNGNLLLEKESYLWD